MFISGTAHYERNISDGETLRASIARLTSPEGQEPGVVILAGKVPRYVLREDHALALCNAIADALDEHRSRGSK